MKGPSATSNLSLPEWVDLHERRDAALWELCYPRNYRVITTTPRPGSLARSWLASVWRSTTGIGSLRTNG